MAYIEVVEEMTHANWKVSATGPSLSVSSTCTVFDRDLH
jgi:hypothetical protein